MIEEKENKIFNTDCLTLLKSLPDHSVDCILTDPPYFSVKGDFDFIWESREDFLAEAEQWATEMERVLTINGSLVWFCSDKMCAHLQVMLERHFSFLNSCTVYKTNGYAAKVSTESIQRKFFSNEERFLFMCSLGAEYLQDNPAVKARNAHSFAEGMCHTRCVKPVIDYINQERERAGFTIGDCNKACGVSSMASRWFTYRSQFVFPTKEKYEKLRQAFNSKGQGEFLRKDYEELRKDYEELRRPFNMENRQRDVFEVTTDSGVSARFGHPTVKDLKLIRTLVRTITRKGDLVLDPFLGSGTTAVASIMEGRKYLGCELDPKYYEIARKRIAQTQPVLPLS